MHCPEPDFKVRQGTEPAKELNEKSKKDPSDMNSLNPSGAPAGKCPDDEK